MMGHYLYQEEIFLPLVIFFSSHFLCLITNYGLTFVDVATVMYG